MDERVRELLKNSKPIPAGVDEQAKLKRLSAKSIIILVICLVGCAVLCIVEGMEFGAMKIMGAFVLVIGIIILLLELKDKIKIKSYEKIYTIHMYVEGSVYYNRGFQVEACYYDNAYHAFNKTTMRIDRMDAKYQPIRAGQIIKVLVGVKKSKIHYIALK